jgi:peroxiredoxin Q/BCP
MSNIPQIGQPAPDFSTPDQNNNLVNIADLNQWLVLYFYPKDNTPGCTTEAQDFTLIEAYGAWRLKKFMGKEYMGVARSTFLISPDKSIAYAWPNVKTKGHAEAVLKKIKELAAI